MKKFIELSDLECTRIIGGKDENVARLVEEVARMIGSIARSIYNIRRFIAAMRGTL